jgi:putative Ca2+/H+ antiporter (TMEM165/GDT1 family)
LSPLFLGEAGLLSPFLTIVVTIFIAELSDKDALLLLTLATRIRPLIAFAAGAVAFTITTTIFVTGGYLLAQIVPVFWIKIAGGAIMIGYGLHEYFEVAEEEKKIENKIDRPSKQKSTLQLFLGVVSMLAVLDIAGDATEILTIVFVGHYGSPLLVFVSCVVALVSASAVETVIGNRLRKFLTPKNIRYFSLVVFLVIGTILLVTTIFF